MSSNNGRDERIVSLSGQGWTAAHAAAEGDYEGADAVREDWAAQLAAARVRYDDLRGRWVQD